MKTSLALIGFMGVGKSAVAELLARRLGKTLVEIDCAIERRAEKSAAQIFKDEGEIGFRQREIEAVKEIAEGKNQVVACGGGVVLNLINIDRLKRDCVIIWLKASAGAISKRTQMDSERRPALKSIRNRDELKTLIKFRQPFYVRSAELEIDTTRLSVEKVAQEILEQLEHYADYCS
jgi:shikimate kinase